MVGDGATDAEAAVSADLFVGFGGNQAREVVRKQADWFVYDFNELIDELKINWLPNDLIVYNWFALWERLLYKNVFTNFLALFTSFIRINSLIKHCSAVLA